MEYCVCVGGGIDLQDGRAGQVATIAEVRGSHHVLGVKHLLRQVGNSDGSERVRTTAGQRGKADHEEVETWERHHVDSKLTQVGVELTRESKTSGNTRHDGRHQVVQIAIGRVGQLQGTHADIVQSFVVNAEGLVGILNQLMNGERGVVRLHDSVRNLGGWHDREGSHHTVWELLANLGDKQSAHTGASTTAKRVGDLESLKAVAAFSLTADDIKNLVDKLSSFSVMALGPVVAGTGLTKDEVVGTEELAKGPGADGIHRTRLQVNEDSTRNVLVARGLRGNN